MLSCKPYLISLFLAFAKTLPAQDITGTWEGTLSDDQFLQVNIIQVKDKLCGYTWDYVFKDQKSYCKAYFTGTYNKKRKEWVLEGSSFIVDSTGHLLMNITLWDKKEKGKSILVGFENIKNRNERFQTDMNDGLTFNLSDIFPKLFPNSRNRYSQDVFLEKVSEMPTAILDNMKDCMKEYLKQKSATLKTEPVKIDTIKEEVTPVMSVPTIITDTVKAKDEPHERITKESAHLVVATKKILLNVYDNALVDGDTVSIYYNDKLLLSHQKLSEKPITIELDLTEGYQNKLVLFAENLGSIPPNTALIVVNAGNKRYELFSSASLTENSMLIFEYKPD